jgi:peptide deformylase
MAVRTLLRLGHPVLRSAADPVPTDRLDRREFQGLVDDLIDTLRDSGGVGLAAPQVGESIQVFVYGVEGAEPRILVNPMVEPRARELIYDWEGCLSIPGLRGLVPRYPEVRVEALDRHGDPVSVLAEGFEARIIQHEFDHLNGVVYLDRMRDLRSLAFEEEWQEYLVPPETGPDPTAVG